MNEWKRSSSPLRERYEDGGKEEGGKGGGVAGAGSQCNRLRCQKQVFIVLCAYGFAVQLCLATGTLHLYDRNDVQFVSACFQAFTL